MKAIRTILAIVVSALLLTYAPPSTAQSGPAAEQRCEGPAELCQKVVQLQAALDAQKRLSAGRDVKEQGDIAKVRASDDQARAARMAKVIAAAATLAVALRMFLLTLQSWRSFFTTDKGKAWLKAITVCVGFVAFFLTNVGFGIPWWQALILAAGGPGAIVVHEMMKLVPVLRGKKAYADAEPADGADPAPDAPGGPGALP